MHAAEGASLGTRAAGDTCCLLACASVEEELEWAPLGRCGCTITGRLPCLRVATEQGSRLHEEDDCSRLSPQTRQATRLPPDVGLVVFRLVSTRRVLGS